MRITTVARRFVSCDVGFEGDVRVGKGGLTLLAQSRSDAVSTLDGVQALGVAGRIGLVIADGIGVETTDVLVLDRRGGRHQGQGPLCGVAAETALVLGVPAQGLGRPGVTRDLFACGADLKTDGSGTIRLSAISARKAARGGGDRRRARLGPRATFAGRAAEEALPLHIGA